MAALDTLQDKQELQSELLTLKALFSQDLFTT